MADKRITELTSLLTAVGADVFAIVDNSVNETKKISLSDLMGSPGPIGSNDPDAAVFASFELEAQTGPPITNISQNVNLGNSNTTLPTQRAVKAYVDAQLSIKENVRRVSSDSTAVAYDIVLVDTTNGDVTIELFDGVDGKLAVKKISSDSNQVIVTTSSGATIDGQAQFTIATQFQSYYFLIDSGEFFVI